MFCFAGSAGFAIWTRLRLMELAAPAASVTLAPAAAKPVAGAVIVYLHAGGCAAERGPLAAVDTLRLVQPAIVTLAPLIPDPPCVPTVPPIVPSGSAWDS